MRVRNARGEIEDHGPTDARSFSDPRKSDRQRQDEARARNLRGKFGITAEQYEAMAVAQGGRCAICRQPERVMRGGRIRRLAVDHDHETGRVRGLLCQSCNVLCGLLRDDPAWAAAFAVAMTAYMDESNITARVLVG